MSQLHSLWKYLPGHCPNLAAHQISVHLPHRVPDNSAGATWPLGAEHGLFIVVNNSAAL